MSRGFPTVLVTTPKLGLLAVQQVRSGGPNCGWLNILKNSVRNSRPRRSLGPKVVRLNTATSQLLAPCIRTLGSTRASSPNPHAGGGAKQDGLNQPSSREVALPERILSQPGITSGRSVPIPRPAADKGVPLPY